MMTNTNKTFKTTHPIAQLLDTLAAKAIGLIAPICIVIILAIIIFIAKEAIPIIFNKPLAQLFGAQWIPVSFQESRFGILPLLCGSAVITCVASVVAVPGGLLMAVYIAELAGEKERLFLKASIEFLAAIPSVVLGFFGLLTLGPLLKATLGLDSVLNGFVTSLLLGLMALPTIVSVSEDALHQVPKAYREGALALGATSVETTWQVMVPAALPAIIAACMLGIGRLFGETMVALMLTGNAAVITLRIFDSMRTLTATIASEMGEVAQGSPHYQALFFVGLVLLILTLTINMVAQSILLKQAKQQGG